MNERLGELQKSLQLWREEHGGVDLAVKTLSLAEAALATGDCSGEARVIWHDYLNVTRKPLFLKALPDNLARAQWAESTFLAIDRSKFSFETMLNQRVAEHPARAFLQTGTGSNSRVQSYSMTSQVLPAVAAAILALGRAEPRVAIISQNTVESANCDLACLAFGIFVTPLSPHFNNETLAWIVDKLSINIVAVSCEEHRERLEAVRRLSRKRFTVLLLDSGLVARHRQEASLAAMTSRLSPEDSRNRLRLHSRPGQHETATVMFTSGSTGLPKGVRYTLHNLITKRFARAAALPEVGEQEVLFCFLPLFHTFGRYLELTGSLFWGGTYVFAENPSFETLLSGLQKVEPTGLISIPYRWQQLRDTCLERLGTEGDHESRVSKVRQILGRRLRWGLSAAGALEPEAFRFFHRYGVDLCSGFGMTEATGGITMTPPGAYEDDTVGIPLPGVTARLSEEGELQISGPYIARYLDDPEPSKESEKWLSTGDIFHQRASGYFEIIDRVKDIYKNSKGQTVAPGAIESKLLNVPGIQRSFLVGDGRDYNVVLLVPDAADPVLGGNPHSEASSDYFTQILTTVNQDLAPYERVVNFAVLDRDFSPDQGELTPKGSFRRKVIQENFRAIIERLYERDYVELTIDTYSVRIPRWFFRDLGILESEIVAAESGVLNRRTGQLLTIRRVEGTERTLVGNLEYNLHSDSVRLGLFARQPLLWVANPALASFCPCREGWDYPLEPVSPQVWLPWQHEGPSTAFQRTSLLSIRNPLLLEVNRLCAAAMYTSGEEALDSVTRLRRMLPKVGIRLGTLIRRRLESLARHPDLEVRCSAYQTLLLAEPIPDYSQTLPSFLLSGLPFLNDKSIRAISRGKLSRYRLDAFRRRLLEYRKQLAWPTTPELRNQFSSMFTLLVNFVSQNPTYYASVRAELATWVLHVSDPDLSEIARQHLDQMAHDFETHLRLSGAGGKPEQWHGKIVFEERLSEVEIDSIKKILIGTTFLKQSTMLSFDGPGIDIDQIDDRGIWISRVFSFVHQKLYRVSINAKLGQHFDLLLAIQSDLTAAEFLETTYWMISLCGRADGVPVVRRFGCYRPELGALSMALVSDLTLWERVRELAGGSYLEFHPGHKHWRNLFVRGMSAFFSGWKHSQGRIIPGSVTPINVVVPAPDYRTDVKILSLIDWQPYNGPLSLLGPLVNNFLAMTIGNYPRAHQFLQLSSIFEACAEALGQKQARQFLSDTLSQFDQADQPEFPDNFREALTAFLTRLEREYYVSLPLVCAIERYQDWSRANPDSTHEARELQIMELHRVYRLERFGDIARYHLYRHTYFESAEEPILRLFDSLLKKMFESPDQNLLHLAELSELQAALLDTEHRLVFSRLMFPTATSRQPVEVLTVSKKGRPHIVIRSEITDSRGETFIVREPVGPAEIGRLYKLFLEECIPMSLARQEEYLVLLDADDQVVGGICYKHLDSKVVHLDGVAVATPMVGRGLSGQLLEEFCRRMQALGIEMVNTLFIAREFYLTHGFQVDKRWAGLVRYLGSEESVEAAGISLPLETTESDS